jgi:hypothetical protein
MLPISRAAQTTPPAIGPVAHLLMGAASGILAVVGLQYLLVRLTEVGVGRAMSTPEPPLQ